MNWDIHKIEAMNEEAAFIYAKSAEDVKGHKVYFVDFGGYFGYSALVFFGGRHIHYANDYQLHHPGKTQEELHEYYVRLLNERLFTDEELAAPLKDYAEYTRKDYYLRNYYPMRAEHVSAFFIGEKPDVAGMHYNPYCWAYFKDEAFVQQHIKLVVALEKRVLEMRENYDYWFNAFLFEMRNHEYSINWQGTYDVISVFARIKYNETAGAKEYMQQAGFNDVQQRAFLDARAKYLREEQF